MLSVVDKISIAGMCSALPDITSAGKLIVNVAGVLSVGMQHRKKIGARQL